MDLKSNAGKLFRYGRTNDNGEIVVGLTPPLPHRNSLAFHLFLKGLLDEFEIILHKLVNLLIVYHFFKMCTFF